MPRTASPATLPGNSARAKRKGRALVRVSKERDGGVSPEQQEHLIQQYADRESIEVVDWIYGVDGARYSGSRESSKWWAVLDESIGLLESGDRDVLLVWEFSRTARNRLKWALALNRVDNSDGTLESVTERVEDSPSGRLQRGMHGEFNAYYAELVGQNWKETGRRRLRDGKPHDGNVRFGYTKDEDRNYVPDPDTGPILAEMYHRYVELEQSFTRIARWMNDSGIPTRRSGLWDGTKVRFVLESGFAAGLLATGRRNTSSAPSYVQGAHPKLITEALWERFLARRAQAPKPPRVIEPVGALTGLLRCGDCGGKMVAVRRYNRPGTPEWGEKAWACRSSRLDGRRFVSIVDRRAMEQVKQWVEGIANDLNAAAEIKAKVVAKRLAVAEIADGAEKRAEKVKATLGALTVKWVEGKLSEDAYQAAAARLQDEIDRLSTQKREASAAPIIELDARALASDVLSVWDDATAPELNRLLRKLAAHATVHPDPRFRRGPGVQKVDVLPIWEQTSLQETSSVTQRASCSASRAPANTSSTQRARFAISGEGSGRLVLRCTPKNASLSKRSLMVRPRTFAAARRGSSAGATACAALLISTSVCSPGGGGAARRGMS